MKTFKEIRPEIKEELWFANSGGTKDQYKDWNKNIEKELRSNDSWFANSGGPNNQYDGFPNKKNIKENLNPRNDSEHIETDHDIFLDPIRNNNGIGSHHPRKLGVQGHPDDFVFPHLTDEHARDLRALLEHVKTDQPYSTIVHQYTTTSEPLNHALYVADRFGSKPPERVVMNDGNFLHVRQLDKLIASHKLPHDMIVYSGLHTDPNTKKGKIARFPGFTSVSLSPHVSKDFGDAYDEGEDEFGRPHIIHHIMRLHLPKGHPHLLTDQGSVFPGQSELILPRNLKLQIGSKPTHIIHGNDFNSHFDDSPRYRSRSSRNQYHIWNARILPKKT